jgi:hypothetical protein
MDTKEIEDLESAFNSVANQILDEIKKDKEFTLIKVKFDFLQFMIQKAIKRKFPDSWFPK